MRPSLRACAAALALPFLVAAAPAAPPVAGVDGGGGRAFVRADPALPLAGIALFVPAGLSRQSAGQDGLAALVAEALLHEPVDGVALEDAVAARGGSIAYVASAQYVRFYLEAQPQALAALAPLVARAFAKPAFEPAALAAARDALGRRIADNERDPRWVGLEMLRRSYYRDAAGTPALGTPASLAALDGAAARAFYAAWYARGAALIASVGQTGAATAAAARTIVAALPAGAAPAIAPVAVRPFGAQPKRMVTRRDVFAPYVVLGFAAPPLGDGDFAAALVVRALITDVFEASTSATASPLFRPAGTIYGYDTAPAQLAVWLNGSRIDPTTALAGVDAVLKDAAAKPLAPALLARYRETARGAWALESVSLDERAFAIGNAAAQGLDAGAADGVGAAISAVTAADVERVAKRWFRRFDVALVLPRQSGDGGAGN